MPPKCKVRKTLPAIGPKGCKAKPEEPWPGYVNDMRRHKLNKKVAELNDLVTHTEEIRRVIQLERQAKENAKKAAAALRKEQAKVAAGRKPSVAENMISINFGLAREVLKNQKQFKIHDRLLKTRAKINAAATRQKIINRIKGARGRKHMAVH